MSHFWPRVIITSLLPLTKMDFYNILVLTIFSCVVQSTMSQRFGHKYHFLSRTQATSHKSIRLCWELEGIMKLSFVELQITDCLQFFNLSLMSERSLRYKIYAVKVALCEIYIMHIVYWKYFVYFITLLIHGFFSLYINLQFAILLAIIKIPPHFPLWFFGFKPKFDAFIMIFNVPAGPKAISVGKHFLRLRIAFSREK